MKPKDIYAYNNNLYKMNFALGNKDARAKKPKLKSLEWPSVSSVGVSKKLSFDTMNLKRCGDMI